MPLNNSQNTTLTQFPPSMLWPYTRAALLVLVLLLVMVGDSLVLGAVYKRASRNLTVNVLTELLLCDMVLVLLILPVAVVSVISRKWVFGNTFCDIQGVSIQVFTTVSYLLRMVLAVERMSFVVKKRGMRLSSGTGRAVSFTFLGIAILNAVFLRKQGDCFAYMDGFYSCSLIGGWLPISMHVVISVVPCVIIFSVSMCSLKPLFCKAAVIGPTTLSTSLKIRQSLYPVSGNVPPTRGSSYSRSGDAPPTRGSLYSRSGDAPPTRASLYSGSGDVPPTRGSLYSGSGDVPPTRGSLYSGSGDVPPTRGSIFPGSDLLPEPPSMSLLSVGETRTTDALALLNIFITVAVFFRVSFIIVTCISPSNYIFQSISLACYIIPCVIQPVMLVGTSPALRTTIWRMLKPRKTTKRRESRSKVQPLVVLLPRENTKGMPTFLQKTSIVKNHVRLNQRGKVESQLSTTLMRTSLVSTISSISLNIDIKNKSVSYKRRRISTGSVATECMDSMHVRVGTSSGHRNPNHSLITDYNRRSPSMISFTLPNCVRDMDSPLYASNTSGFQQDLVRRNTLPSLRISSHPTGDHMIDMYEVGSDMFGMEKQIPPSDYSYSSAISGKKDRPIKQLIRMISVDNSVEMNSSTEIKCITNF